MRAGTWIGGEEKRMWKSFIIPGRRGMKKGRPRKCCKRQRQIITEGGECKKGCVRGCVFVGGYSIK
jgi:hypothetical protein